MNFTEHYELQGKHAYLSPSQPAWLNYPEEKLVMSYTNYQARALGTRIHELASELIELGIKLPRTSSTLNAFVNDAIGYKMNSEVLLYYSDYCFGTADAISFNRNLLRIGDLKTGVTPASMQQLKVYAAIFCLEYKHDPAAIDIELRLYQFDDDVQLVNPDPLEIKDIMDKIIESDRVLSMMGKGVY